MTITAFAATQTGDFVETAGVITGVANVEQSFATGLTNKLMSPFNGGKTFTTGLGNTIGELAIGYVAGIGFNKLAAVSSVPLPGYR